MPSLASTPRIPRLQAVVRRRLRARAFDFGPTPAPAQRQLLVDVSTILRADAGTGIQRSVRALLSQLPGHVGPDMVVQPVFASRDHGYCRAGLNEDGSLASVKWPGDGSRAYREPVVVRPGDVFLGLDLCTHLFPLLETDLAAWRAQGVSINVMVYDLLPLQHPDWFPRRSARRFEYWMDVVARQADRCICISHAVAADVHTAMSHLSPGRRPEILVIPLGADIGSSVPSTGLMQHVEEIRAWVARHRTVLCVGTVEPRKGHDLVLAAASLIWRQDPASDFGLVIVGRPGWKTQALQQQLRTHPEHGRRLLWLDNASDQQLSELYSGSLGLLAASRAEGFGLPLLEALAHGLPALARDLPVFHEIGGTNIDYFDDDAPSALADRLLAWLSAPRCPPAAMVAALPRWSDSAQRLLQHLGCAYA